ncbi:HTH-type transcriptional regulator GlvR [Photorhabdus australis subsp. thailandensis]|uniref:HTH-type transcriptional regulator GlvR n=1 Tax=Photorhabdus australis subsp. thailandensis TaxID=2805096 RepID=A0A1C0TZR2_9GAMM|nr:MurR/RpiR family transcriptional regulator [Photorhabdus australis]OCQ51145.1 HTH-type transcriptional regulator GlvR [Photorhabdus australis subsp. thailandensis]
MDNRLAPLLQRSEKITRAEYRVLSHLTANPLLIGQITVRELAKATFISPATIMRLCQKLGFSGYSEFIWYCKQLLSSGASISGHTLPHHDKRVPDAFEHFVTNYRKTFTLITPEKIARFSALLHEKDNFFLYGAGFSGLFTDYLTQKLQILGKTAFSSSPGDSRKIFLSNAVKYEVFIAISRSGQTEQVLDKAHIAHNVGMTVIAFTRASTNPLASLADVHFALYDEAIHFNSEVDEITSFESNLIMLIDLLLLQATS